MRVAHAEHYYFAHYALREFAFANPVQVFALLSRDDTRQRLFAELLGRMASAATPLGVAGLEAAGISCSGHSINGRPCAIIAMPTPTKPAEAFLVAILSRCRHADLEDRIDLARWRGGPGIDYYTLEKSTEDDGGEPSIFCSWNRDGAHTNYGAGSVPEPEQFARWLAEDEAKAIGRSPGTRAERWLEKLGLRRD